MNAKNDLTSPMISTFRLSFALLVGGLCLAPAVTRAQAWIPTTAGSNGWASIVCSADGTKVLASATNGFYASSDSGATWIQSSPVLANQTGFHLASSADGTRIVAAAYGGPICVSTDSGFNWTQTSAPATNWYAVASSADGTHLIAVGYIAASGIKGFAYTSTNSGADWQRQPGLPSQPWYSVCSSADGRKLAVAALNGGPLVFYTSTDFGVTWAANALKIGQLIGVATSADGSRLVAVRSVGTVYTSQDFGASWKTNTLPSAYCSSVAASADLTRLLAGIYGYTGSRQPGPLYTSADSGSTWTSNNVAQRVWNCVASSADGTRLYAAEGAPLDAGQIYTFQSTPTPKLTLTAGGTNLALSWIVPGKNFILQQSGEMSNWSDLTNTPVLDMATLQERVVLSTPGSNTFYRLKTP